MSQGLPSAAPWATNDGPRKVAVYLPYAYTFSGPMVYVPIEHIREVDLSVEDVLKLSYTAQAGMAAGKPDKDA